MRRSQRPSVRRNSRVPPVFRRHSPCAICRRRNVSRAICANTLLCRLLLSIRRCSSSAPTDVDSKRPPSAPPNLQAPKQLIGLDFYGQCRLFCCITSLTLCVFPTKKYDTSFSRRIEKRTYIVPSRTKVTYEFKFYAIWWLVTAKFIILSTRDIHCSFIFFFCLQMDKIGKVIAELYVTFINLAFSRFFPLGSLFKRNINTLIRIYCQPIH